MGYWDWAGGGIIRSGLGTVNEKRLAAPRVLRSRGIHSIPGDKNKGPPERAFVR